MVRTFLPASKEVALQDKFAKDPLLGAFIQQLPDAHAHFFVDETAEKDTFVQATDRILLKNEDIKTVFEDLIKQNQKLYDDYWAKKK
jgi:multiple sugar transport system substrate-binding protein